VTIRERLRATCLRVRSALTPAPVDREKLDLQFRESFWYIIDLVIADKDVTNDHTSASRFGLFVRGLERISRIAITASVGWGFVWVLWYYEAELGHSPKLTSLGDVFSLGVIGVTGPLVSLALCTLVLWSGISLSFAPMSKREGTPKFSPGNHLHLYAAFFGGATLSAVLFIALISANNKSATAAGLAIDLFGPFFCAALMARVSKTNSAAFRAHWTGFLSASVSWGLASVLTGLGLAQSIVEGSRLPGAVWFVTVSTFALIAILSVFPIRFGLTGAAGAYCAVLILVTVFCGPLLRDAPFRIWHIGGLIKRVAFIDREEERKAHVRCKMIARSEPHAYSMYILSDLPGEIWYRCDPVHVLANTAAQYIPRLLDPAKVIIEDN